MTAGSLYPAAAVHARLAHDLGRQIVSGKIREGDVLPGEAELAIRYKASRQAVREGLKVLAAKGLITPRRRAGTFVTQRRHWNLLDPDILAWHPIDTLPEGFLQELIDVRQLIEPHAAELAARRSNSGDVARIALELTAMKAEGDYTDAFYAADTRFHIAIFTASGNSLIEKMSAILDPLLNARFGHRARVNAPFGLAIQRHGAVYEAIRAGDPIAANLAMRQVLDSAQSEFTPAAEHGELLGPVEIDDKDCA